MTRATAPDAATRQQMRELATPLLTERQMQVFCLRHGLDGEAPMPIPAVARQLGIHPVTARRHVFVGELRYLQAGERQGSEELLRRYVQLGREIDADGIWMHAAYHAWRLFRQQPDFIEEDLPALLAEETIYTILPAEHQATYRAKCWDTYTSIRSADGERAALLAAHDQQASASIMQEDEAWSRASSTPS